MNLKNLNLLLQADKKIWIDIGTRYGIFILVLLVGIFPSCNKISREKKQLATTQEWINKARIKIAKAIQLQRTLPDDLDKINNAEKGFFSTDELPRFLGLASEIASQSGLELTASQPVDAPAKRGGDAASSQSPMALHYQSHDYQVQLLGGYHNLGQFLTDLKLHPKIIQVKKLLIEPGPVSSEHKISLILAVYSKRGEKTQI